MRMWFRSVGVDNDHRITMQTDRDFILLFQRALLLGLKDAGHITIMQHRQAEEVLFIKFRNDFSKDLCND